MEEIIMKLHDEIAKTAHELYEKSGWIPGRDMENWIEAEKIVKSRYNGSGSRKEKPEGSAEESSKTKKTAPTSMQKAAKPAKTPAKSAVRTKKTE